MAVVYFYKFVFGIPTCVSKGGFEIEKIMPTETDMSIIESVKESS